MEHVFSPGAVILEDHGMHLRESHRERMVIAAGLHPKTRRETCLHVYICRAGPAHRHTSCAGPHISYKFTGLI